MNNLTKKNNFINVKQNTDQIMLPYLDIKTSVAVEAALQLSPLSAP